MKRSVPVFIFAATFLLLSGCATVPDSGPAPLTLAQIVDMAKQGKDAPTIIGEIKLTHAVYDVTASQYAKLSRDGVPDAVLDYMQQGQIRMAERAGRREARHDLWMYGPAWAGYGPVWYPRSYFVYVRGRPYAQQW
ncbi:MAG: hypothetical protein IPP88_11150 [Betaproteobacteria bacterium]|nr:hypothetical protein [Betaproteobacteria bacterium]